ncbi:hypothetical protein QFC21_000539 [Naganishia friedmannii]|uniref:Uncharacterized protein n=1 Tax=Naganishia friedmannii TaxID=89922 RepID=A0ACC2WBT5_9TREE|nr:hypothetical protein QFC21_000539 [Naganishia friedmannii]
MLSTLTASNGSTTIPTIRLNNGIQVPVLGFGTAIKPDGKHTKKDVSEDVKLAYSEGFQHIDCAERYGNEMSVGAAVKQLVLSREALFIATKCMFLFPISTWLHGARHLPTATDEPIVGTNPEPKTSLQKSLDLFVDDVGLGKTWLLMEELQKDGKATSIGVSNARVDDIDEILKIGGIVPAVNQIELHPYCYDKAKNIVDYCHSKGIIIEVFCALAPLTQFPGGPVDVVVKDIASQLNATEDQVLLKWAHQVTHGGIVLVSSASCKKTRLEGYRKAFTEMRGLTRDQLDAISAAGAKKHQRVYGTRMDEEPSL